MAYRLIFLLCAGLYITNGLPIPEPPQEGTKSGKPKPVVPEGVIWDEVHDEIVKNLQNESISDPDPSVGFAVDLWRPGSGVNPEELGTYTQGDMLIPSADTERNGIFGINYRWPGGIVYYEIERDDFTAAQRQMIMSAIGEYHRLTCIQFRPYTGKEPDYIHIQSEKSGCWSAVGRIGGRQTLNLQSPGCLYYIGTTIHEFLHALGFYHEQSRTDRDDYIQIMWANIKEKATSNFREQESNAFGVPYDYGSVMHYSSYAFSKNHERTIVPKTEGKRIGQRIEFSPLDIQKVNTMYKCTSRGREEDTPLLISNSTLKPLHPSPKPIILVSAPRPPVVEIPKPKNNPIIQKPADTASKSNNPNVSHTNLNTQNVAVKPDTSVPKSNDPPIATNLQKPPESYPTTPKTNTVIPPLILPRFVMPRFGWF